MKLRGKDLSPEELDVVNTLRGCCRSSIGMPHGIARTALSREELALKDSFVECLATNVDEALTKARVVILGVQAPFGFQFVAMLTTGFDRLPLGAKILYTAALAWQR
jgi:hypothetical protein